ncbi:MAG: hypothetical protein JNM17_36325 [Archangium sp.]|nr:hypothetical protein [Archangium sp.]
MRTLLLSVVLLSSSAFAAETAAFVNLVVEPNPALTEPVESLQKKFFAVAREKSGYTLALRPEAEDAVKKARITDFTQDTQLARVATNAGMKNAGYFTLQLALNDSFLIQGRVVAEDGKLLKSALISVPRNGEAVLDALGRAATKFFDVLNGTAVVEPLESDANANAKNPGGFSPPPLIYRPEEPRNPGTPLRIAGAVIGAGGIAATVTGVVLFATSGSIVTDGNGNVSIHDVGRVNEVRGQQGAALGALTAGVALAATGALMIALAPNAPVTAGVAPTADGALFAVGGSF